MDLFANPRGIHLTGCVGERLRANARGLVSTKDEAALLAGVRSRPGAQIRDGEHVGQWIDAARRVGDLEEDALLESKIARVVAELLATQERDGYLGTDLPAERWTAWDVWAHEYALLGLTAQARSRGCDASLDSASRFVDLLWRRFGANVDELFSARVSAHQGLSAGSVLRGLVRVHAIARDAQSLELANAIAAGFEQGSGPRITSALREHGDVTRVANGKAYELISCLVALLELDELAPDPRRLEAAEIAARDLLAHHVYPSGGLSHHGYFTHRGHWSEAGAVSETGVVVAWLELLDLLWRRTGSDAYLREIQRTWMNALLAAQRPDGAAFCEFTPLAGGKAYDVGSTGSTASGPRGIALAPRWFARWNASALEFLSFAPGEASFAREGGVVRLEARGDFLLGEPCRLRVVGTAREPQSLYVRKPGPGCSLKVVTPGVSAREEEGRFAISFGGRSEIEAVLRWDAPLERVPGRGLQAGRLWLWRAPWLLCADDAHGALEESAPPERVGAWRRTPLLDHESCASHTADGPERALVAFAEAGRTGSRYRATWPEHPSPAEPAHASASGNGVRRGALDSGAAEVLWSGSAPPGETVEFALRFARPRVVHAVVFRHAMPRWETPSFAAAGAARIELCLEEGGPWVEVAELPPLPALGAPTPRVDPPHGHERRASFAPRRCFGVRVRGRAPATGEVFCAGLRAES
ncbi:MAG: glycoside hydrolase family 127 protein [Planctomycetes bacterium]|nr:glycoside hydrolase family 127 protein [Planctomycetota bacterium]